MNENENDQFDRDGQFTDYSQPENDIRYTNYDQYSNWNNEAGEVNINGTTGISTKEGLAAYTGKTFLWMFAGLVITFITAYLFVRTGYVFMLYNSSIAFLALPVAEVAVVFALGLAINKISPAVASFLFIFYSILTGLTFSEIFIAFDAVTVIFVFCISAAYFGIMAAISLIFKVRLNGIANFILGALIMLIVMEIIGMFVPGLNKFICLVGIAIFSGCTAYDTSKIKDQYEAYSGNEVLLKKASIISALNLYLDFINIFIYLLRLFGGSSSRK